MTAIEEAAASLAKVTAARADLVTRMAAVESDLRAANMHQNTLAQQSWRGADIAPRAVREAGKKIEEAEESLAFLRLQVPQADAAVAAATAAHAEAVQEEKDADFAVAVRALITVSRDLTGLGAAMTAKGAEYLAAYERVILAKSATGTAPNEADRAGYQSARSRLQCVVPLHIQHAIIASGANHFDVGARDFSHWGRFAAPDPTADASTVAANAAQNLKVAAEQAFDEAGRVQAKRSGGEVSAWQPTEMRGHNDPVERRLKTVRSHTVI